VDSTIRLIPARKTDLRPAKIAVFNYQSKLATHVLPIELIKWFVFRRARKFKNLLDPFCEGLGPDWEIRPRIELIKSKEQRDNSNSKPSQLVELPSRQPVSQKE
jgi:hypothetical protein